MLSIRRFALWFPILFIPFLLTSFSFAQIGFTEHTAVEDFDGADYVYAADLDGDHDIDLLGASLSEGEFVWWENDGTLEFEEHLISDDFNYARIIRAADLDSDGDLDVIVVGTTPQAGEKVSWWENDGYQSFTEHDIAGNLRGVYSLDIEDVDIDGDLDVFSAGSNSGNVYWWENDGEAEPEFTEHVIADNFICTRSICTEDMNNDGYMDIITASLNGYISVWENDDEQGFSENRIIQNYGSMHSMSITDINGDGLLDVITTSGGANSVKWFEQNDDGEFITHNVSELINAFEKTVLTADIDMDDDQDLIVSGTGYGRILWFENDGEGEFEEHDVTDDIGDAQTIFCCDVDRNYDIDILGVTGTQNSGDIYWYENSFNPDPDASLTGTITDLETGETIENAVVTIEVYGDSASDEGEYEIEELYSLMYCLVVQAEGFETYIENDLEISQGANIFNVEMRYPASFEKSVDEIILLSEPADSDTVEFSFTNNGGVPLEWDIEWACPWLSVNQGFGSIGIGEESTILIIGDAAELGEDLYIDTLILNTNDPENASIQIPVYFAVGNVPPFDFSPVSPDSGAVVEALEVELTWEFAFDPNIEDEIIYSVLIASAANIIPIANPHVEGLRGNSYIYTADRNREYFWSVIAYDSDGNETRSSKIFSFTINYNDVIDNNAGLKPSIYSISKIYPNPFNPNIVVEVGLPEKSNLKLSVFNINGREVAKLTDAVFDAGYHSFSFVADNNFASGVYFIQAVSPKKMFEIRKVLLVR